MFSAAWAARDLAEYGLVSGLERPFRPIGEEEYVVFSCLLAVDRVRPRPMNCCSGDDSPPLIEAEDGGLLVKELALSAMDCAEEPLVFLPTPKNVGEGPVETAEPGWLIAPAPPPVVDSFSRAFILCAIPPPKLTFFTSGVGCGWLERLSHEAEADLAGSGLCCFAPKS